MAGNPPTRTAGKPYQRSADNLWCQAIELPRVDGKRQRKVVVGATPDDAERKMDEFLQQLAQKDPEPPLRERPVQAHRCPICGMECA